MLDGLPNKEMWAFVISERTFSEMGVLELLSKYMFFLCI